MLHALWHSWLLLVALGVSLTCAGCMFRHLEHDLARVQALALLQGQVTVTRDREAPLVVILSGSASGQTIDFFVLARPGPFFFSVPAGTYRLAVFEDRNADLRYQPDSEPAVLYAAGGDLVVQAGQHVGGLDMVLNQEQSQRIAIEIGSLKAGQRGVAQLPTFHVGTIVSLDDPRFAADNAALGLWQPVQFVFDVGAGVYFLEEYDPEKIPVLFVHGAVGTPRNFEFLIRQLDRTRFQPWLVYYPTALDLESTARAINRCMLLLHARYRYAQIAVVAHSMGGLVARAAINHGTAYFAGRRPVTLPGGIL